MSELPPPPVKVPVARLGISVVTYEDSFDISHKEQAMYTTIRDANGEVVSTNDPALIDQLLNERTGTTPEQRQRMAEDISRREDERRAREKARDDGFTVGLYLGFAFGGAFAYLMAVLFGSPIKGILL